MTEICNVKKVILSKFGVLYIPTWKSKEFSNKVGVMYGQNLKRRQMAIKMAGKLVTSNIASACNQWYSKDSVFWLAQLTLYVMA